MPSDGPTVRSSRYLMPAGSAPERRIMDRSFACCWLMLPPLISPGIADRFFNVGDFLHFIVEHHAQALADVRRSEAIEPLAAFTGQGEANIRLAVLVGTGLRVAQILSANRRNARNQNTTIDRPRPTPVLHAPA